MSNAAETVDGKPLPKGLGSSFLNAVRASEGKAAETPPPTPANPNPSGTPPQQAAPPAQDDFPAEVKSEAARTSWKALKAEREALRKERDELKTKYESEVPNFQKMLADRDAALAELKAKGDPAVTDALKKERDDLYARLRIADIEKLPDFQSRFIKPIADSVKAAVDQFPVEKQRLAKSYIEQPESPERTQAIKQLIADSGMDQFDASIIAGELKTIRSVRADHASVMSDQQKLVEARDAYEKGQREKADAQRTTEWNQSLESTRRELEAAKLPFFTKIDPTAEGAAAHNAAVDEAFGEAVKFSKAESAVDRAKIGHWAAFGIRSKAEIGRLMGEVQRLNETIAKLSNGRPNPTPSGEGKQAVKSKNPFTDIVMGRAS